MSHKDPTPSSRDVDDAPQEALASPDHLQPQRRGAERDTYAGSHDRIRPVVSPADFLNAGGRTVMLAMLFAGKIVPD